MTATSRAEWVPPARPAARPCGGCQTAVEPLWIAPRWTTDEGSLIMGTGKWLESGRCDACTEAEGRPAAPSPAAGAKKREQYLAEAGLLPLHQEMELAQLRGDLPPAFAEAIHAARYRGENLYLFGAATGVGKTHAAVGLLKHYIRTDGVPGYFHVVPKLMLRLRELINRRQDGALVTQLCDAGALVLDDLGVEKTTEYVIDRLNLILDHWMTAKKKRLIITSNLSPGQIAEKLDPRIASRINSLCRGRIVEVRGEDYRVKRGGEAQA